jgi:hypothetical protein
MLFAQGIDAHSLWRLTVLVLRSTSHVSQRSRYLAFATFLGLAGSLAALASNITIASPVNGARVTSTVWVRAHNVGCDSLAPVAFGYSIDNGSAYFPGVTPYDIDVTRQTIGAGTHTIHFKSWTTKGICPVVSTSFLAGVSKPPVTPPPPVVTTPPVDEIPSNAIASSDLEGAANWEFNNDPGTPGTSRGSTLYPAITPSGDEAREFYATYSGRGGEIFHVSFAVDPNATHFVYDSYIYVVNPAQIANIEMDMNQVMANGDTIIFGTQCSTYSKSWEYTTAANGGPHWHPSNIPCNPETWIANSWHHVQIASHRDAAGVATYDWVNVDGTHSDFTNATGSSALTLGWQKGDLLLNFQLDGSSPDSSTMTAYLHKLTIYRW